MQVIYNNKEEPLFILDGTKDENSLGFLWDTVLRSICLTLNGGEIREVEPRLIETDVLADCGKEKGDNNDPSKMD